MFASKSKKYVQAVTWIAHEDEPGELDRTVLSGSISVALVADLFKVHELDVAKDIITIRKARDNAVRSLLR
jgi:hypothetical protein